nr:MAG: putative RNA-dependent RNA polymerase [Barnaviridae sp.]
MDANPGVPFTTLGCQKNSQVFSRHYDLLVDMVCEQVVYMVCFGQEFSSMTSESLIAYGIWDPIRLFIKNEPHPDAKLAEGRLRLIANVSLRTQLIERWLCGHQNALEIANWYNLPVAPGVGLDDDSLNLLTARFGTMLGSAGRLSMTDVSGWDWAVKPWLLWADAERRRIAAGVSSDSLYAVLLRARAYCTGASTYALSDGSLIAQETHGIQNSGSYCTSSTNSWMRVLLYLVARQLASGEEAQESWLNEVVAMGDDCVEGFVPGVLEEYLKMGFKSSLSAVVDSVDGIEFCSHRFDGRGLAIPTGWDKTLFRFFSGKPGAALVAQLAQLEFVLRHHPRREEFMTTARKYAFTVEANKTDNDSPQQEIVRPAEQGPTPTTAALVGASTRSD